MKQQQEQIKLEIITKIQQTKDPILKRVLEKRLKEIDKIVIK